MTCGSSQPENVSLCGNDLPLYSQDYENKISTISSGQGHLISKQHLKNFISDDKVWIYHLMKVVIAGNRFKPAANESKNPSYNGNKGKFLIDVSTL